MTMLKNYFKTAYRMLWRNKGFSAINILGLTAGMASAILILLWVQSEVSTDRFYSRTNDIYVMYHTYTDRGVKHADDGTPYVLAPALRQQYPEVEQASRFSNVNFLVSSGDKHFNIRGAFADSSFLSILDLPLLEGNREYATSHDYGIVLTESLSKRLFGTTHSLGKSVRIDSNAYFTVSAVLKDLPTNTLFNFDYLLPWSFLKRIGWDDKNWTNYYTYTLVMLRHDASEKLFDSRVKDIIIRHTKGSGQETNSEMFTQPLSRYYLYSKEENGQLVAGRLIMVRLFTAIAIFILLIACINFMNLSTARSEKRAKEVGIRKVAGAVRMGLIGQFIGESMLVSFLAFLLSLLAVQLALPAFNLLIGKSLAVQYTSPVFWLACLGFVLFTGITAGSYPAFFLSSFKPVSVLKGTFKSVSALVRPRKLLVILQFTFAILLIISTVIIKQQIDYGENRDAGYSRDNLIYTYTQGDATKNYPLIKQELLAGGTAVSVTKSMNPITLRWSSGSAYQWPSSNEEDARTEFIHMGADADFVKTMGLTLLEGRDIDIYKYPTDSTAVLLNEAAVQTMRFKNPVGQIIGRKNYPEKWHVVGVIKNFILESPFESKVNPVVIYGPSNFFQIINIKLNPQHPMADNLAKTQAILKKYNQQYPVDLVFVDEAYASKFYEAQRTGKLSSLFAGLTIVISCLGLFGLATYMAEKRIKEIGVRKVLGASVSGITLLLSRDFLQLVLIAFVVASPLAWFLMNKWLENYTYRTSIAWWVFAGTGLLSLFIAAASVIYQSVRAALANPVKSLRTE
jgi:putative ABC transport system permease protein